MALSSRHISIHLTKKDERTNPSFLNAIENALEEGYATIHGRLDVEASLHHLGPETKRFVLGPLVGKILSCFLPDVSIK